MAFRAIFAGRRPLMDTPESVASRDPKSQPASGQPNAIATFDLTRKFGEMTAVDHINLRIRHGSIFGLLGPNGAGKSTTIKMLTTLLPPTSGTATVAGFDIVHAARSAAKDRLRSASSFRRWRPYRL